MNDQEREELLNLEIMTPKEARNYCKEHLHISDAYFADCVMPLLRDKFKPILQHFRRKRPAMLVIKKIDVENFVINQLKKLDKD